MVLLTVSGPPADKTHPASEDHTCKQHHTAPSNDVPASAYELAIGVTACLVDFPKVSLEVSRLPTHTNMQTIRR